ncbi:MAG TPA: OmpH family outer membrane protein [Gemmatimonadales bacterium]|nr:OmpH family outer membrane protein [Gemmatimonadales bacterium]
MRRAVVVCLTLGIVGPVMAHGQSTSGGRSTTGAGASAGPQRVAFIRSRAILDSTPGYTVAESTFAREFQGMRDEVQKLQQQLDSAVQSFDQASIALSPAAKDSKRRDLQQMQDRMNQRSSELDTRARARNQELLGPFQQRINTIIQGMRAEGNYSLIFDADAQNNGIVAADLSLDLTPKVIARVRAAGP